MSKRHVEKHNAQWVHTHKYCKNPIHGHQLPLNSTIHSTHERLGVTNNMVRIVRALEEM